MPFAPVIALSALNGANGFRIEGAASHDFAGWSVASAGDVNGDGLADLIIGATGANQSGSASGAAYVVFGQAGGFSATLSLSDLDGTNGFRLNGVAANNYAGFSVTSAGDLNSDGYDDLVVGAPDANPTGNFSGAAYVVYGKSGGFTASIALSSLDGTSGFRLDNPYGALRGGLGADIFRVAHVAGGAVETDQIYDFNAPEGDTLDLSAAFGGTISLVGALSKQTGQMTLTFAGGITTLRLDTTGDGKVDYQMKINGDVTGESGDWLF
ncbi:MAG: repeat protein [Caulobacter sp.]|nr:repeat protein [Caulobacter sp.]